MMDKSWSADAVQRRLIHERYILFILICTIVGLVTVKWSEVPKLTEYLSFALTLASLLLATLAIWYAMYSNRGLDTNLASLASSVGDVREIASSLSTSSTTLSTDLRNLAERTGGMDKRIDELVENTRAQDQKKNAPAEEPSPHRKVDLGVDLVQVSKATSINGNYVLIGAAAALLNKKALNLIEFAEATGVGTGYCNGYIMACAAIGLFEGDPSFTKLVVTSMPGANEQFLKSAVDAVVNAGNRSKVERMPTIVTADLGKMRTYLEDHDFKHFGALDKFDRVAIPEAAKIDSKLTVSS